MDFATISEGQVLDFTVLNNIISNQKQLNALVNNLSTGVPSGAGITDTSETVVDKMYWTLDIAKQTNAGTQFTNLAYPAPWQGRIVNKPFLVCSVESDANSPLRVSASMYNITTTNYSLAVWPEKSGTYNCKVTIVGFAKVSVDDAM